MLSLSHPKIQLTIIFRVGSWTHASVYTRVAPEVLDGRAFLPTSLDDFTLTTSLPISCAAVTYFSKLHGFFVASSFKNRKQLRIPIIAGFETDETEFSSSRGCHFISNHKVVELLYIGTTVSFFSNMSRMSRCPVQIQTLIQRISSAGSRYLRLTLQGLLSLLRLGNSSTRTQIPFQ